MPRVKILPHELKGLSAEAEAHITAELRKPLTGRKPRAKRGTGKVGKAKRSLAEKLVLGGQAGGSPLEAMMRGMLLELDDREPLVGWSNAIIEYQFDFGRKWRFDFAWPMRKVAVELEGGVYSGGRHTRGKGFEGDCEKYNRAAALGWLVLRYTTGMLRRPNALEDLRVALKGR